MGLRLYLQHGNRSSWRGTPVRRAVQLLSLLLFLYLLFCVCWPYGSKHHANDMQAREVMEAEFFLALDPLVSMTTAIAARAWIWSLGFGGVLMLACLFIPRGFCSYICPLGTLIDGVDWAVTGRFKKGHLKRRGWWVHIKHYLLAGLIIASLGGVLLSGFAAPIPLLTRGMVYIFGSLQLGLMRGWYLVPPMHWGHFMAAALFVAVFALGWLGPRFWCRNLCPTGALLSLASVFRVSDRIVSAKCVDCGKCRRACSFDAIREDVGTRPLDCTFCQSCASVCPVEAINFTRRGARLARHAGNAQFADDVPISRRGFAAGVLGAGVAAYAIKAEAAAIECPSIIRPPGSIPEERFRRQCIRCGECIKACPFMILQAAGFEHGMVNLWTPRVNADWSGCDATCTNCGQVCPTGAIRALRLEEKKAARMALAVVNEGTCLPHAGRGACRLCENECTAAGYNAIEFMRVGVSVDDAGHPIEGTGHAAPIINAERCVGCGLCQTRCFNINVIGKGLLRKSAILLEAGPGKEDRILSGSYRALREAERAARKGRQKASEKKSGDGGYLPDFLK